MMDNLLNVESLSHQYDSRRILREVSLSVGGGELVLLLGDNGSGKSTLLNLIVGHLDVQEGSIEVFGRDRTRHVDEVRSELAYLPQRPRFAPGASVREVAEFYTQLKSTNWSRTLEALEDVGLQNHTDKTIRALSGGMLQRLGLALMSLSSARLWLLDEPAASLDASWRKWLRETLRDLASEGRSVLLTSQLPEEWESIAHDKYHITNEGNLESSNEEGTS